MSDAILIWDTQATSTPPAPRLIPEDVREWEEDFGLRLPGLLAWALVKQNGGCVHETGLSIDQLDDFSTLDEQKWAHVYGEGPLANLDRGMVLYIGDAVGCGIALDYSVGPEPRVLLVEHNCGGRLGDPGLASFAELLRMLQAAAE